MEGVALAKRVAFIALMGALGNALAFLTLPVFPLAQHVYLDLSSLPVLVAAVFGGAYMGAAVGLIAGLTPSIWFGFIGGTLGLLGFSASVGKALHGFTVGLLVKRLKLLDKGTWTIIPAVILGFVPEALWIMVVFQWLVFFFVPAPVAEFMSTVLVWSILSKATFEVVLMAFFTSALSGHGGFKAIMESYLTPVRVLQTRQISGKS
ncbi:MAG: hypothetical protein DRJ98_02605 [Thermoprotei archaeon]|nr:MAG: hypothetical protein DRJ98_02605 [Thermoprotei archaeon]RLF14421.1 MAG: hypothetical protein DRN06_07120 [Thermoprotei archaeon]